MYNTENRISTTSRFDPEDERIFCANVNKRGETGHGLLKKYYIPHLGVNICEYCEVEEDGERRNLSYYQSKKLSRHLISELQNWREEIIKFQNINNDVSVQNIVQSLQQNNRHLDTSGQSLNKCKDELTSLKSLLENKLLSYFSFLEEILLIKDLIDECKFDKNGKLNLVGIGTDSSKEAKYIWMSLLFSNMKRQNLNPESFGLTEEVQKSIKHFVNLYISVNSDCTEFVRNLCFDLLPEIARLENKQITTDCEDLVRRMPTTTTGVDISIVNKLNARIAELEQLNTQKDSVIYDLRATNNNLTQRLNGSLDEITQLKLRIEELLRQSSLRDPEISNLTIVINQIQEENNRNRLRISELENIINQERRENDLHIAELNQALEKLRNEHREVKISHENLFLANKELEALLLAERERGNSLKQTIEDLQAQYQELNKIRDNLLYELQIERNNKGNTAASEREIDMLRKALTEKEKQINEFNAKYFQMITDYDYLKLSNESLKKQLEGHIANYNLLTGINHGLAKRQAVTGENKIMATSIKNLPVVDVQTKTPANVDFGGSDDSLQLVSAGAPQRSDPVKALFENKFFVANDTPLNLPFIQTTVTPPNAIFTPNRSNPSIITTSSYVQKETPQKVETASILYKSKASMSLTPYENERYLKDIDFINVNPKNLLLTYSSLHKICDWVNSLNELYNIFKVKLLYKSTYENFSAGRFKALCSGIPDVFVIALTSNDKIIGGYTPLAWNSGKNSEEFDSSRKTFIFTMDEDIMFPIKSGEVAIANKENYGPVFGRNDLEILDDCRNIETSVNPSFGSSFKTNGMSAEEFFGGSSYSIKEYEVYQIYSVNW